MPTQHPLHVEILLTPACTNPTIAQTPELSLLHTTILSTLQSRKAVTTAELPIPACLTSLTLPSSPHPLNITRITTTLSEDDPEKTLPSWRVKPVTHLYTHSATPPPTTPGASITALPSPEHDNIWRDLRFPNPIKSLLLSYATTRARTTLPCSGFILLHGPPGSGKSSLATALAQKLAVRQAHGWLVRLSHAALSKYFGESAHRLGRVFHEVLSLSGVVVLVVDEIETFGMVRGEGGGGSGDGTRVTNALLTGLDAVRSRGNVVVVGTSNNLDGIDVAVTDRADLVLRVGAMDGSGRVGVLRRLLEGLVRDGVLASVGDICEVGEMLQGVSARRVEGCVVVALGIVAGGSGGTDEKGGVGKVEWEVFEKGLREAARVVATGDF